MNLSQHYQQQHRSRIADQADHCVKWLKSQGFDVLSVSDGPRITIRPSPLCKSLQGAVESYSSSAQGEQRYKTVTLFDCEVRWAVEESAVQS